jgi:transcriptional regulator with GAF, ATPase, and Fis domain/tetratricopeptide (TPR) repeat protein
MSVPVEMPGQLATATRTADGDEWRALERAGEGASAVVWRARHAATGQIGALKKARDTATDNARDRVEAGADGAALLAREARLLARVGRRWGPSLLDAGPGFLVTEWSEGEGLDARLVRLARLAPQAAGNAGEVERQALAARVAHGVARGLQELHEAGVHHGDVKPANVLCAPLAPPPPGRDGRDVAEDRGATLIDLGLAGDVGAEAVGGTPRYASPELRERGEAGPAADLWALGLVLAEVVDPAVARSSDPRAAVAAWGRGRGDRAAPTHAAGDTAAGLAPVDGEIARWIEALLSPSPGGRPSAAWVARRAARRLGLRADDRETGLARVDRVRRAYLAQRATEIEGAVAAVDPAAALVIAPAVGDRARGWIEKTMALTVRLGPGAARRAAGPPSTDAVAASARVVEPLGAVRRSRWLVALVGPSAAAWPLGVDDRVDDHAQRGEAALVDRLIELAGASDPASWTLEDVLGRGAAHPRAWGEAEGPERTSRLVRELARGVPSAEAMALAEDEVARGEATSTLAAQLASALARAGETGRAWAALLGAEGIEAAALRAEIARRRGDEEGARRAASAVLASTEAEGTARPREGDDRAWRWSAQATLARLLWEASDLDAADRALEGAQGPAAATVRALIALRRGDHDAGVVLVERALLDSIDAEAQSRLEAVRGLLEMARGGHAVALGAFGRAVELATRAGAVLDEATYLTSEAAAATDLGDLSRALGAATRAALLWERLGRPERAARAWLARAAALATLGAVHAADEAADEARARGGESRDARAIAYARWAQVEARAPGDVQARAWAVEASDMLRSTPGSTPGSTVRSPGGEDALRASARCLVWAPDALDDRAIAQGDAEAARASAVVQWEWWGARARAFLAGRRHEGDHAVLAALRSVVDLAAPLWARGPALDAAAKLATEAGDGDGARRFELARTAAARALHEGTPAEYRASLASVTWARTTLSEVSDVAFAPAQVVALEGIVRSLSSRDGLRPLLEQVLDTLVLWTGVERGLLLLRAPDGRLVPRAARNLARRDLVGEQLALSQTIARRAIDTGDAVVATDALSSLGAAHASVHALRLRSVLAVPLLARGEALGVVYLDDRVRKGAFGPRELAWVRVVASQAAMAIADARDNVLLRRTARRAERARVRVEALLRERETELEATRSELELTRDRGENRYKYDAIAGRSEPMRDLLRLVDRVTASDVPVLVLGESGTGKELIARAIHANGARSRRAFVSENCASVPESLLESTLFGHMRGAFTGASSTRAGLFDVADGGSLFLDEIGEMSLGMQSKLLRVLQDGEVRAVGGEKSRRVDVRVIGATHRDLEAMVAAGTFREDLFYRLNVITLRVPALRERPEDIPLLFEHFARKHAPKDAGDRPVKVTRAAMAKLVAFPWPGNVRQLENEVRRALVLADGTIDVAELSADVVRGGPGPARGSSLHLRSRVDALESSLVQEALAKTRGNQTRAAQLLGLSRFGLQKMMKRLGVKAAE